MKYYLGGADKSSNNVHIRWRIQYSRTKNLEIVVVLPAVLVVQLGVFEHGKISSWARNDAVSAF